MRFASYPSKEQIHCDYCHAPIFTGQEAYYEPGALCLIYCSETCAGEDATERNAALADGPPVGWEFIDC